MRVTDEPTQDFTFSPKFGGVNGTRADETLPPLHASLVLKVICFMRV